ncbi:Rap family tetratricopeptide repeat protein [Bacillus sp. FSL K6-0972]|uniref:Rap family tetratricopeptide repeat protein n=1 Tax=Bacillus sp. FSL K6-0972 TaxID=2921562 RepID=UPI0030DB0F1F
MTEKISSAAVGVKINEWYRYIRIFSVPDAEILKAEIERDIQEMEEDQDLLLYYSLMEFRHRIMLEYIAPSENSSSHPSISELLHNIDNKQARLKGILEYYYNFFRGMYENEKREYISAITYYKQAENKLALVEDEVEKAEFFFKIAEVYYYMKQTYFSMHYAQKALERYREQETYNLRIIQCHTIMAGNWIDANRYEKAVLHLKKALEMAEEEKNKPMIARALYNIGVCYYNQDLYEQSVDHFQKAILIFKEEGFIKSLPQAYFLMTQIHFKQKNKKKAQLFFDEGCEHSNEVGDSIYSLKFEFLKGLYLDGPDTKKIDHCLLHLESKKMFPDVEDMSLDVAKYYHENECFEMSSLYFLKVEEARKQTQRGDCLYEVEV